MTPRRSAYDVFSVAIVAALIALAIAFGARRGRRAVPAAARVGDVTEIAGALGRFTVFPTSGRLAAASFDGRSILDLEMSLLVDGNERPLVMRNADVQLRDKLTLAANFPIEMGDEHATGALELRMDPASDYLTASVIVTSDSGRNPHSYALRFGFAPAGRTVFVPGAGTVADLGATLARGVVISDAAHPLALLSAQDSLAVADVPPDLNQPGAEPRIVVSTRAESAAPPSVGGRNAVHFDISILIGASDQEVWGRLYKLLRAPVAKVNGVVTGTPERAEVLALDEDGRPQLRAKVDPHGRFSIEAPVAAVQWLAVLETAATSAPVRFTPGSPGEVHLDISPGGELHVRVVDADTKRPVVARLIVKGVEGTASPNFGPDYRASGAGPLMDVLDGEAQTPLPAGHYRVAATKGLEWSIDAETVEVQSGHTKNVDLALRHVVPTPGVIGCDLHVHARPSFDTPVSAEDRVLSLVSAGIDFAVPTEHNIVGDYTSPLAVMGLTKQLASVTGVEVTTYKPSFGHFGAFPFPPGTVPKFKNASAASIFASAKRGDPSRVFQVNHPRLHAGIGYFNVVGFDPKVGKLPAGMRTDFDTLEVYNGYDLATRGRTEAVLEDWFALLNLGKRIWATGSSDSHRIQYQWAGYPRTMVHVDPKAAGDSGRPIEAASVVAAIKSGHSFVTSGPMIELELLSGDGKIAHPGDDAKTPRGAPLTGRLRVRAAPWIDVTSVEVMAGIPAASSGPHAPSGRRETLFQSTIPSRPTYLGKEEGPYEEAATRTIRFDADLALRVPEGAAWIAVVVRGERIMDDALPFMPIQPLAFTNPIWLTR